MKQQVSIMVAHHLAGARISRVVIVMIVLGCVSVALAQEPSTRTRVSHNTLPALAQAQMLGPASRDQQLHLAITLNVSNPGALKDLIERLYDPASPEYRRFLTPAQFADRFAPSRDQYDAVIRFLEQSGLRVTATYRNRLMVEVRASVAQVESAFALRVNYYAGLGKNFFANDRDPELPTSIASLIASVSGMENYLTLRSHARQGSRILRRRSPGAPTGYSPQEIAAAYDFTSVYRSGIRGAGQTLAIATAGGFNSDDVAAFWRYFGIRAPSYLTIAIGGSTESPNVETTIDLERSGAMANLATIMVYEAVNPQINIFESVYNRIVTDNIASVVTTSWGLCEPGMPSSYRNADSAIFAEAAVQGQAWFAASGDGGAYDCGTGALAVDYPASDPNVAAAGGTTLNFTPGKGYQIEQAWSAGGGGLSGVFAQPSYQQGPGVTNSYSNGLRQLADIAFNSDPDTGYSVYYNGSWSQWGGTSFAAPHWAAIFALANAAHGSRLGAAGPTLYGLANNNPPQTHPAFHDITSGDNGHYDALSYWDFPTGWGTPMVGNLILDLK
jgi:subtilase family serine protease